MAVSVVLLMAPGSPSLILDGLPFGRRIEVLAFALVLSLILCRPLRKEIERGLQSYFTRSLIFFGLTVLIVLKIFTFFRFPIGENFEVCLKSTYEPVNDLCEKSFDYLFHSSDLVNGLNDVSRIDKRIDFGTTTGDEHSRLGASHSSWNLPFQNEFPRLAKPWLDRLPFSATIGGVIDVPQKSVIPVEVVGRVKVSSQQGEFSLTSVEDRRILLLPVEAGIQRLRIEYEFSDDRSAVVPDDPPISKGPYAHLVVAAPIHRESDHELVVDVEGFVANTQDERDIKEIVFQSANGAQVASKKSRPDVAESLGNQRFLDSGFEVQIPIESVQTRSTLRAFAVLEDGSKIEIGVIRTPLIALGNSIPVFVASKGSGLTYDLQARLALHEDAKLLEAESFTAYGTFDLALHLLLNIMMIFTFFVLGLFIVIKVAAEKFFDLIAPLVMSGVTLAAIATVRSDAFLGAFPSIPQSMTTAMFLLLPIWWIEVVKRRSASLYVALISFGSGFIVALEAFRNATGLRGHPWWGHMIFRERVMDWFVFQGYAYQILVQQSLKGGELLYYFMPGSRYFIFLTHILFGNNDVLIGIFLFSLLLSSALAAAIWMIRSAGRQPAGLVLACTGGLGLVILSTNDLAVQLSISSASEVFAWVLFMFLLTKVGNAKDSWGALCLGTGIGLISFLRPNYLFVSVGMFVIAVILTRSLRQDAVRMRNLMAKIWLTFGFSLASSLALLHNIYYSGTVNFFTNRVDPTQTVFEPGRMLGIFTDAVVREELVFKLNEFLYWQEPSPNTALVASWIGQFLFVAAVFNLFRIRRALVLRVILLLTPLAYVVSAVPFGIMTIPERQFNMMSLVMIAFSVFSIALSMRREGSSNPSVEISLSEKGSVGV